MKSQGTGSPYGTKHPRIATNGSPVFMRACKLAEIQPTRRMWSKWKAKHGTARSFMNAAIIELAAEANGGAK